MTTIEAGKMNGPQHQKWQFCPFFNPDAHSTQVRSRFDLEIKISFGLGILIRHTLNRDGAAAISAAPVGDAVDKLAFVPSRGSVGAGLSHPCYQLGKAPRETGNPRLVPLSDTPLKGFARGYF
jgi:hypothetical protein